MLNKVNKMKNASYSKAIDKIIEESGSIVNLKPKLRKIQKQSRRSDDKAVKSIVLGNRGILQAFEKRKIRSKRYVELTSLDLDTLLETAVAITSKGGKYLAAPISGVR
ncbi:hypothetical protein TNIN_192171 [Trichonephila inaurata madagascariensis]|uniref:Uncharacterized protein n=1 Tax=Trichonephila inaurata madagascariensis TaxID=2747483 RepID=A0A8X6IDM6_9ARAC|nr:hypothetical protein TNIN_192171 [Trichonephila inaurata madagascariensis]